jgi:hypothetical protein
VPKKGCKIKSFRLFIRVPFAFHLRSSCLPLYCNASALIKNAFLGNGRTHSGYTRHNIGARRKLSRLPTVARYSEVLPSSKSRKIKISCPVRFVTRRIVYISLFDHIIQATAKHQIVNPTIDLYGPRNEYFKRVFELCTSCITARSILGVSKKYPCLICYTF